MPGEERGAARAIYLMYTQSSGQSGASDVDEGASGGKRSDRRLHQALDEEHEEKAG